MLEAAGTAFLANADAPYKQEFWHFCNTTSWLHHYALFMALKRRYKGKSWEKWPAGLALLTPEKYDTASVEMGAEIGIQKYIQWQFFRQWHELRSYAAGKGIAVIGDIPIFVGYDSADVWSRRELFLLNAKGNPTEVAGVPPDYFSATGQLWGNPLYDWEAMEHQKYAWWIERFQTMFDLFDVIRIDHFEGSKLPGRYQPKKKQRSTAVGSRLPERACLIRSSLFSEKCRLLPKILELLRPKLSRFANGMIFPV